MKFFEAYTNAEVYVTYWDIEFDTRHTELLDNEMILALCNIPDSKMYLMKMED